MKVHKKRGPAKTRERRSLWAAFRQGQTPLSAARAIKRKWIHLLRAIPSKLYDDARQLISRQFRWDADTKLFPKVSKESEGAKDAKADTSDKLFTAHSTIWDDVIAAEGGLRTRAVGTHR